MEASLQHAIEAIHEAPTKAVLYVTGGASHAPSWLLSVPRASATVLECRVPYDRASFIDAVGEKAAAQVSSYASKVAAQVLAKAAYQRAVKLALPGVRVCGVAAACSLITIPAQQGNPRAYVATHCSNRVAEYELHLQKGQRVRWDEELISSRLVVQAILDQCALPIDRSTEKVHRSKSKEVDALTVSHQSSMSLVREWVCEGDYLLGPTVREHSDPIQGLLRGDIRFAEYRNGMLNRDATSATLIFPGSFNPLHIGHKKLLAAAQSMYPNDNAAYEISVTNPDKPPLDPDVTRWRLSQFAEDETVLITSAPLFSKKAEFFADTKFVIGVDTALRIVDPKYYNGEAGMIAALLNLQLRRCKFLVAGRLDQRKDRKGSKTFLTLLDVPIPTGFGEMFEAIPINLFRVDISSSELRAKQKL